MVRARLFQPLALVLTLLAVPSAYGVNIGGAGTLTVSVDPRGTYEVAVPQLSWRFSGSIGYPLLNVLVGAGVDRLGPYQEISFDFQSDGARHASIRSYPDRAAVLFAMSNPAGTAANSFSFPSLSEFPQNLDHLTFSGSFAPPAFGWMATESPWAFFDSSFNTFIVSPASNFMTAQTAWGSHGELTSGISPAIVTLPQGFEQRTLLVVARGINRAFDEWGNALTALQGKTRPANDADAGLRQIGYWTDNGATYYYRMAEPMSYQQTLNAVKSSFDKLGIGLGYVQLDSWFYPKGPAAGWSDNGNGIYQYTAASLLFSAGLSSFQQKLGVPLITHARWIDAASPYRKTYQMSGNVVTDAAYWDAVADYLANSGVATYEQDWLSDKAQAAFNLHDSDTFLDNMAASMERRNLTMQYCMATPRHFMQSSKYSNLTTIRTSADRLARDRWTDFLYTSRFASALGVWPFTDNFLSTETTHMLLATLSAGPVGIGDPIGAINGANLLRAVRKDGVIVKPDVPLTPVDASFAAMAHAVDTPQIASTWSDFGGLRTTYVFAYTQGSNSQLALRASDLGATGQIYAYDYFGGNGQVVEASAIVNKTIAGDALYLVLAPLGPSGMAILGDVDQFVTMGKKRVTALTDDGEIRMTVAFAAGETARIITGYARTRPTAHATEGTVGSLTYTEATGIFQLPVMPGDSGSATIVLDGAKARKRAQPVRGHTGTR